MKYFFSLLVLISMAALKAQPQTGKASFYADKFEGSATASGEKYRANKLTAAHQTLPFGTIVKVTNLGNNESVRVTINDRGPYARGRVIDLSRVAAEHLKFIRQGTADVRIEVVDGGDGREKKQPVVVDPAGVEEKEFYDLDINKIHPKGFGAQVGTFEELANLLRVANHVKNAYKKRPIVQVKVVNGVRHYRLTVGPFSSQAKAEDFVRELKKQFPDALVVDYSRQ